MNKTKLVLLITASMNIKVILKKQSGVIQNNQYLSDKGCFWGLSIFSIQNRSTISRFVPPWRRLTLYHFPGCLSIHFINSSSVRKQKQMKITSLNFFTGQTKIVIYVFHSNGNSFDIIFITIIQPKYIKVTSFWSKQYVSIVFILSCFHFKIFIKWT